MNSQVPVDRELLEQLLAGHLGMDYKAAKQKVRELLATPAHIPDADHSEDVRTMVVPDGYKLVPIEPTKEMMDAALMADCGEIDPRSIIYADYKAMLAASPAAKGGE